MIRSRPFGTEVARSVPRESRRGAILAPYEEDAVLAERIAELRVAGEVVVVDLPGHDGVGAESACERRLVRRGTKWVVEKL